MRDRFRDRWTSFVRRVRRLERREIREFRAWVERTHNVVHLSALVFVPLLVATVTYLANTLEALSFLLFPPLASGTYTLFSEPHGEYASPIRFVAGLTAGAFCGWLALWLSAAAGLPAPTGQTGVSVVAAAVAVFLAGVLTWVFDVEEPSAYSTALLGLLVPLATQPAFVVSVALSTTLVAVVFAVWRYEFYDQRADILYQSTSGDDHVLVPMRGEHAGATAMLGARIAAAHDAGKVVLLDVVEDRAAARAERTLLDSHDDVTLRSGSVADASLLSTGADQVDDTVLERERPSPKPGPEDRVAETVHTLEERASDIETTLDVPCEVVVAVGEDDAATVLQTAQEANCDLITIPYREHRESVDPVVRDLFASDVDVIVHRSVDGRTRWRRVMVPVRRTGHVAHSMVDFALRLARSGGSISVSHCIRQAGDRRRAEAMLADLVEPFHGPIETRVARAPVQTFLANNADQYDLVFVGASQDRSAASRFVSPPTFERLRGIETDVAIVDRG